MSKTKELKSKTAKGAPAGRARSNGPAKKTATAKQAAKKAPAKKPPTKPTKKAAPTRKSAPKPDTTTAKKSIAAAKRTKTAAPIKKKTTTKTAASKTKQATSKASASKPVKVKASGTAKALAGKVNGNKSLNGSKVLKNTTSAEKKPTTGSRRAAPKVSRPRKSRRTKPIVLPDGYRPSEKEPFMSPEQQVYFRDKLVAWKDDIIRQTRETLEGLTAASEQHADVADRATSETDRALELRARDRQRKLVSKINSALARIEEGSYGYCEETGDPINLRRLEARPIATLSLEAQERHERRERVFRED